ncbi:uncharacterized protein FPRN_07538 [Fusarium proliferatum]|nr:uncharacterized protein FPRN_07538 [Fusarium proliferatum]
MAPNKNKNHQPKIPGTVSNGSIRFNSQAASLPQKRGQSLVIEQSSVTKIPSFAINTNALAKNAREEFYKDTVVLRLRGLAHQVTLFKIQSLNQATIAQILTEVQATNACMDGMETHMDEMSNIISQRKLGNVLAGLRWARPWLQRVLYDIPYKIFRGIRNVPLGFYYHAIWS